MNPTRRPTRGGIWLSLAILCGLALLLSASDTRAASAVAEDRTLATVAVVKANTAPEGSALACVRDLVAQGISVKEALDRCLLGGDLVPGKPGLGSFFGLGGMTASTSVGTATCNGNNVNPELATDWNAWNNDSRTAPQGKYDGTGWEKDPGYKALKDEAQTQWEEYWDTLAFHADQDLSKLTPEERQQALAEISKEHAEANKAIDDRDAWRPDTSQTDPNAASFCADIAAFIGECNRAAWKTGPCQIFLGQLRGCADPTVTDPVPDGDGTVGCKQAEPDAKTVEKAAALVCSMRINPVPGEDPCAPVESAGVVLKGWFKLMPCRDGEGVGVGEGEEQGDSNEGSLRTTIPCDPSGDATPCGSPVALTQEGQCVAGISVAQFGQKNIEEVLAIAGDKLGGPSFVVPLPAGPLPGGGGGDPEGP